MVIDSIIDEKHQHHDGQRESETDHAHRETSVISVTDHDDHKDLHDERETSVLSVTTYHNQREASMIPETGSLSWMWQPSEIIDRS